MGGMNPGGMHDAMGGMMGGAGSGGPRGGLQISEDEYVKVWEQYCKMMGRPFNAETVRGWYRQYRYSLGLRK